MRCLIDTHVFIWWAMDDSRLSEPVRLLLRDAAPDEVLLSAASAWEMAIKIRTGRLKLKHLLQQILSDHMTINKVGELPVRIDHTIVVSSMPLHHRDPFDRLIVAQGIVEGIPLVTSDPLMSRYPVNTIW